MGALAVRIVELERPAELARQRELPFKGDLGMFGREVDSVVDARDASNLLARCTNTRASSDSTKSVVLGAIADVMEAGADWLGPSPLKRALEEQATVMRGGLAR